MKILSHWELLRDLIVFTTNDMAKILQKSPNYAKIYLNRLKQKEIIYHIERNKYTLHTDPILIATKIYVPSYLSLMSALRFHNMTTQLPTEIELITPIRRKTTFFRENTFNFHFSSAFWGFKLYPYQNYEIFVSDPEKTIIDCIHHQVPLHLVYDAVIVNRISEKKLIDYLIKFDNQTIIKRVGYMLEKAGMDLFSKFKSILDDNYVLLESNGPKSGIKNRKWKILENMVLE